MRARITQLLAIISVLVVLGAASQRQVKQALMPSIALTIRLDQCSMGSLPSSDLRERGWGGNDPTAFTIASGGLVDPTGLVTSYGNYVTSGTSATNKDIHANLTTPLGMPGTTTYFSWLLRPEGTIAAGFDNGHFGLVLSGSNGEVNGGSLFVGRPGGAAANTLRS